MAIIKSFSSFQNLSNFSTFIVDTNPTSEYFRITELKDTFSGGKNGFLIEGSEFLKETTEVKIEILDVEGNPIYYEPGKGAPDYYEGLSTLVSVHIYPDTPIGIGKITVLGELKKYRNDNGTLVDVPEEWKGVYNVKWEKTFKINRNLANEDIVRFYRRPEVSISEIVKPIFSKTIPSVTQSGSLEGVAIQPTAGSNLSTWTAGTLYKLKITDGPGWTSSVDENIINIPSLGYTPTVREVLNSSEVLVGVPYSVGNIVSNFTSSEYTTTFEYVEGQSVTDSALTGSFAVINISNLKTFVGDVARVKVFRKSRNEVTDFQFVQESKLESTELLRDITVSNDTQISYGNFTDTNLSNYWTSSNDNHPLSVNVDVLQSSVKCDYDYTSGGVQHLITSESFLITKDVEYTLNFKTLVSGSLNGTEYIKGYFSSSDGYQQTFLTVSGSDIYKTRQNVSQNILASPISSSNAKLVFEISGSDWYISNVSLKNAQETSFSPDEFVLIQEIPRKLATETFDFRFEFYDINNNYIPVDVTAVGTFDGGNDYPTSGKLLTFESDRNAFRFSTGSIQNPENQQVKFTLTQNNLVGTATFASSAYDVQGNYLNPSDYSQYPGFLTSVNPAGALLTINNFTGSRVDGLPTPFVGSIVYTASLDGLEEYETVYRLEDGENAPTLIVTSDANQFIYEPTSLSPKPSGQSITIRAQRKNLASYNTAIEVNKSNSNAPDLNVGTTTANGVTSYTISATEFSASFAQNNFDSVTYSFTGSDVYDNKYSDEVTISKVINFDGVSIVLSTENTSFNSDSAGNVTSAEFNKGDGTVDVRVGAIEISHSEGNSGRNTFDIVSVTPSTGLTANSETPTTNSYGISAMSVDSGTLTLLIRYKAGDNSTTLDFTKVVNYSKSKVASPVLTFVVGNNNQSTDAKSTGEQITSFSNSSLSVNEQYNGTTSTLSLLAAPIIASSSAFTPIVKTATSLSYPNLPTNTDSVELSITGSVSDSEGVTRQVFGNVSLTKIKKAAPILTISSTPRAQSVSAKSTGAQIDAFSNVTVTVAETYNGSTTNLTITSLTATSSDIASISTTAASGLVTLNGKTLANGTNSTTVLITAVVTDSEGISRTLTDTLTLSKVKKAQPTITFAITPAAQTVAANSDGTLTGTIVDPILTAFEGSSALTYNQGTLSTSQYKITNVTGVTVGSTTPSTSTIDVTGVSSADNTGVVTISYVDSEGTSGTSTIKFTISKAIAGQQGVDGDPGADGKRTATGMVHYQLAATSAPSTPSATSFTFSNGTFSGLTTNWGTGAPTYASGNTNKYWYATYTVVETTAGGGTGTPSFGTPTQAIGFSGLVSFTAANNVSDGTNALSFGVAGTTLINGSNISTGKIISTNWDGPDAGEEFADAGMEIDLDNGKITAKQFLIDGSGNAKFKGNITGASGTFSDTIAIGSGNNIFKADSNGIYLGNATFASAPFRVTPGGALTATSVNISGAITATSLTLSGATVPASGVTGLAAVATSGNKSDVGLGSVQNLNAAGQATSGIEAAITISSGGIAMSNGGYVRGGQTDYNTGTGFFLGYSGAKYKFSIGDGSTKSITWDGTNLTVGGDVSISGTLKVGDPITSLTNNAEYQANNGDKTAGTVGGWSINSTTITSNNSQTVLRNTGIISLSNGVTEKILITKDSISATASSTTWTDPTIAAVSTSTQNVFGSYSWNGGSGGTSSDVNTGTFTAGGSTVSVAFGYNGTSGPSGTNQWSTWPSGTFNSVKWTTDLNFSIQLYTSGGSFVTSKSVTAYSNTEYGTSSQATSTHYHPQVLDGVVGVAFSGLTAGNSYYLRINKTLNVRTQLTVVGYSGSLTNTYSRLATNGGSESVDITTGEEKVSIGINGMIISSPGGFVNLGPVASVGGVSYSGAFLGDVKVNGTVYAGAFVGSSDARLKTGIKNIDSPLIKIENLTPRAFTWLNLDTPFSERGDAYGFIAQETQENNPTLIKHLGNSEHFENLLGIDYNSITAINTAAIKELLKKIEQLEERIFELENN